MRAMNFDEIAGILEQSDPVDWYEVPSVSGWDSFIWTLNITTFSNDRRQEIELQAQRKGGVSPRCQPWACLGPHVSGRVLRAVDRGLR